MTAAEVPTGLITVGFVTPTLGSELLTDDAEVPSSNQPGHEP